MATPTGPSWKFYLKNFVAFPIVIILLQILGLVKKTAEFVYALIAKNTQPMVVRTPEERFHGLESVGYTFKPNYAELSIGGGKKLPRLHYVDEGPKDANETILCLHGEPSWSFLYRKMIPLFIESGYRVVAPDFIGFGKSDKFTHMENYSHEMHTMTIRLLLEHLKLNSVTLVCQDWGGLVGLSVVKDSSHFFKRLVMMNTGLPCGQDFSFHNLTKITPFVLWQSFASLFSKYIPIRNLFKFALIKSDDEILSGYDAPFPSSLYKAGAAQWPLLVPLTSSTAVACDMKLTRDFLQNSWKSPVLIMFSDKDPITRGQDKTFLKLCPHAIVLPVKGGRHFLQEDIGRELSVNIISFINNQSN